MSAIALVKVGWTFLRGNWTWALPTIGLVAALAWGAVQHFGWEACSAAAARKAFEQQQAVLAQKEKDRVLGGQILNAQLAANERTDQVVVRNVEVIRHVEVTTDCARSPAMRAADDGLRELGFSREPRPAADGDAAGAGTPAARPRRRDRQRAGGRARPHGRRLREARAEVQGPRLLRGPVHAAHRAFGPDGGETVTAGKSRGE